MAFKLPEDVLLELKKKFPEIEDFEKVIHVLFTEIINKTFKDGACQIRELGKFNAYLTYSEKVKRNVARFKFSLAQSLNGKIQNDPYLLNALEVKSKNIFNEVNANNCLGKEEIRDNNIKACQETNSLGKKRTDEKLAKHELLTILASTESDIIK